MKYWTVVVVVVVYVYYVHDDDAGDGCGTYHIISSILQHSYMRCWATKPAYNTENFALDLLGEKRGAFALMPWLRLLYSAEREKKKLEAVYCAVLCCAGDVNRCCSSCYILLP
jgi:hypothetical protein